MTETELLVDFHAHADRQGPGSPEDTLRALELTGLSAARDLNIADIGCGTGGQTLVLAKNLKGQITAVDLFPEFLEVLDRKAQKSGLSDQIRTVSESMDTLSFDAGSLDLIWSEGAIYNIGFEAGVQMWREYLKPGGYLAVTEITWITRKRPAGIADFWQTEYPEIDRASGKIGLLEAHGYTLAGYFELPRSSWEHTYYGPMESRFAAFLEKHNHSRPAQKLVEDSREEIALYRKYGKYYSYGFYIARKD